MMRKPSILLVGMAHLEASWSSTCQRLSPEAAVPVWHVNQQSMVPSLTIKLAQRLAQHEVSCTVVSPRSETTTIEQGPPLMDNPHIDVHWFASDALPQQVTVTTTGRHHQKTQLNFSVPALSEIDWLSPLQHVLKQYASTIDQVLLIIDYQALLNVLPQLLACIHAYQLTAVVYSQHVDSFSLFSGAAGVVTPNVCIDSVVTLDNKNIHNALLAHHKIGWLLTVDHDGRCEYWRDYNNYQQNLLSEHAKKTHWIDWLLATRLAKTTSVDIPPPSSAVSAVIHDQAGALALLQQWVMLAQKAHERVVFTNGCFDLLHAGHVALLQAAKQLGERLIVAVNDDASVARLKGQSRPIIPLQQRLQVLHALQMVDWVIGFSEYTPETLLQQLQPDILVKGGDYTVSQVVGASIVQRYGGKVYVLKHPYKQISTSGIVQQYLAD